MFGKRVCLNRRSKITAAVLGCFIYCFSFIINDHTRFFFFLNNRNTYSELYILNVELAIFQPVEVNIDEVVGVVQEAEMQDNQVITNLMKRIIEFYYNKHIK